MLLTGYFTLIIQGVFLGEISLNYWTLAFLVTAVSFLMVGMNPSVHAAGRDLTPEYG